MELLMLCHVFPQWEEILQAENNQILNQLNGPLRQDFVCRTHAFPPLLQLWDTPRTLCRQDDSRTCCQEILVVAATHT